MIAKRTFAVVLGTAVILLSCFLGLAIRYWLGWPGWMRTAGTLGFPLAIPALWFAPGPARRLRRYAAAAALTALIAAYLAKQPVDRTWIPLHAENVTASIDGDIATLTNFRDAIHRPGEPSVPRWVTRTLDLSELERAELIMQPFGDWKPLEHVMLSFGFAGGEHVIVSIEARRAEGESFDPLAGFFRHDQVFPVIGTERDQIWQRLARIPPNEVQIYAVRREPAEIRAYFERVLMLANEVAERPRFYSTLFESCMTTLIGIAPELFYEVKWYDIRRWAPGYSLSLFQQLGLIDDSVPAAELARRQRLRDGIEPPWNFPTDAAWSAYIRGG